MNVMQIEEYQIKKNINQAQFWNFEATQKL